MCVTENLHDILCRATCMPFHLLVILERDIGEGKAVFGQRRHLHLATPEPDRGKQMSTASLNTMRLIEVGARIRRKQTDYLAGKAVTPGHDAFLLFLLREDGSTMGMIADQLGIGAPSATKFATKLEAEGHIRRETSRIDSRQNHAFLTEAGRQLAETIAAEYAAIDAAILEKLRAKDGERLAKLVVKLEAAVDGKVTDKKAPKPKKAGKVAKKKKKTDKV